VHIPRSDNRAALTRILETLAAFQPARPTQIAAQLHDLALKTRRKGLVIIISDLFDDEAAIIEGIQHLRFGGHEVIVFHVLDPYELEFPFRGLVEFEGLEGIPKILTRPNEIRRSYLDELEKFRHQIRAGCEKNQCHYVLARTDQPLAEMLGAYLAFRAQTVWRG